MGFRVWQEIKTRPTLSLGPSSITSFRPTLAAASFVHRWIKRRCTIVRCGLYGSSKDEIPRIREPEKNTINTRTREPLSVVRLVLMPSSRGLPEAGCVNFLKQKTLCVSRLYVVRKLIKPETVVRQ